jgi:hypothetical protein
MVRLDGTALCHSAPANAARSLKSGVLDHRLRRDQSERAGDERPLHGNSQAMGTPKGRAAGASYLAAFVEDMKASGFVATALGGRGPAGDKAAKGWASFTPAASSTQIFAGA